MKTLAIVIGNDNYYDPCKLENAVNDATAIKETFDRLGYNVLFKTDCTMHDYEEIEEHLDTMLDQYDASIFYYAGHGFQENGENYLPSVECQINCANVYQLKHLSLTLEELLEIYKKHNCSINIIILDACRRKSVERGTGDSFAAMSAPKGTLLAFSTSPNEGASDKGIGGHSVYTGTLLEYIGRERLAIEDLFKKVRRTVYERTNGKQVTWEHTSLIGDFFFNSGQMVTAPNIPYKEEVVCDSKFDYSTEFGLKIAEIRSCNWNRQNPAISEILCMNPLNFDKDQLFILGRNLFQASGAARNAASFVDGFPLTLTRYNETDGQNHLLNGMLFEVYFNSKGEFRGGKLKSHNIEKILSLRNNPAFNKSFEFIKGCLLPYRDDVLYIPYEDEHVIDFDISAENYTDMYLGTVQKITKITASGKDCLKRMLGCSVESKESLVKCISELLCIPERFVNLHSNIPLQHIRIPHLWAED